MNTIHRFNSKERQHYLLGTNYSFRLRPQLVYVGKLTKQAGWSDETHAHDFAEIILVTDGSGTVTANGDLRPAQKGDIFIYNAGVEHVERSSRDDPMELLFFALDKVNITDLETNCLIPPDYDFLVHTGEMYELFYLLLEEMVSEMEKKERFYQEIAKNDSRNFVMYLFRLLNQNTQKNILDPSTPCSSAVTFINEHFAENICLEDIAAACYLNKYYISHVFAKEMGMSVGQFLAKRRIDEATRLLVSGNLSVNAIAQRSGFNDFSYFCHAFKRATGMSPLQYRNRALTVKSEG